METTANNATFSGVITLANAKESKGGLKKVKISDGPKAGTTFFVFGNRESAYISKKAAEIIAKEGKAAITMLSFGIIQYLDEETGELRNTPTVFPNPDNWLDNHSEVEEW